MKKMLMIAAAATFMMSSFVATTATAGDYTKKCKACHKVEKNGVGPSWKNIQAAYGDSATLAAAWEAGFAVSDRKIAGNPCNADYKKYHKKAKTMSGQYKKLIAGGVKKGKITYKELADMVFSK
ncbi:MAG: c-type cytochrome [Ghiorsea sp.]